MNLQLKGLRALVTGGTKGIGLAIATTLAREGCSIAICARDSRLVDSTVDDLKSLGVDTLGESVDVSIPSQVADWVNHAAAGLNGIDIVVSNVSAASADWQAMFQTDVMGAVNLVSAALPYLEKSKAASIVAISSRASYTGGGAYPSMKCALMSYVKGLSHDLAPKGIRANVISPGDIYFKGGVWDRIKHSNPQQWELAHVRNRLGRLGTPEEVARVVAFVASPAASFVSGANIRVDGEGSPTTQF